MDLDGFQNSFRKLWGYTNSVRLVAEHMSEDGNIVLVSGAVARKTPPGMSAIASTGNAIEGFCRAVAAEIGPLRINVVAPGTIDTPMFAFDGEAREGFLAGATRNSLIKRAGTSDEVADGIMFLIANEFTTGTVVNVDGGCLLP